jgi:hypothetical protein
MAEIDEWQQEPHLLNDAQREILRKGLAGETQSFYTAKDCAQLKSMLYTMNRLINIYRHPQAYFNGQPVSKEEYEKLWKEHYG